MIFYKYCHIPLTWENFCFSRTLFGTVRVHISLNAKKHLYSNKDSEHTVVKVGEECHTSQRSKSKKVFSSGDRGVSSQVDHSWQPQTMNASVSEYV